jgi:hypothetical protein
MVARRWLSSHYFMHQKVLMKLGFNWLLDDCIHNHATSVWMFEIEIIP